MRHRYDFKNKSQRPSGSISSIELSTTRAYLISVPRKTGTREIDKKYGINW